MGQIASVAARYIAAAPDRCYPPEVIDAALKCLTDLVGVAVGGRREPVVQLTLAEVNRWNSGGTAPIFLGPRTASPIAAIVNATMAHVHDFDDTHIPTDSHFSAPIWPALLALADEVHANEMQLLGAFVTGFEVGAKLGGRRLGHAMLARGFQATGVMGRLGAAAAAAALLQLNAEKSAHALSLAATQAGGLSGAAGSMSKAYQSARTAQDGLVAARMAADGFIAAPDILEEDGGLARAFVQDGFAQIMAPDFDAGWEVLGNSFKPYACLHGIHPAVDAARQLAPQIGGREIAKIEAFVAPGVARVGGIKEPGTVLECKFSVRFCVALGLAGSMVHGRDFTEATAREPGTRIMMRKVKIVPVEGRKMLDASVKVTFADGSLVEADVPLSFGHPGNPMGWSDLEGKFVRSVEPELGPKTQSLFNTLKTFQAPGSLQQAWQLVAPSE